MMLSWASLLCIQLTPWKIERIMAALTNDTIFFQKLRAWYFSTDAQILPVATAIALFSFLLFQSFQWFKPRYRPWLLLPCVGLEKGWTLAKLKTFSRAESMIAQGYRKVKYPTT